MKLVTTITIIEDIDESEEISLREAFEDDILSSNMKVYDTEKAIEAFRLRPEDKVTVHFEVKEEDE
jgi:uncharacterized UPF0146 family protein